MTQRKPPGVSFESWVERQLREAAAAQARSESEVRQIVAAINEKIRATIRTPPAGPPLDLVPYDVERIVRDWHERSPE